MGGGVDYADMLRQKILSGISWRDTREARRQIRVWMIESQAILPTPSESEFLAREEKLRDMGMSVTRVSWDRMVFRTRDWIASGAEPHFSRLVRWSIRCVMVAVLQQKGGEANVQDSRRID